MKNSTPPGIESTTKIRNPDTSQTPEAPSLEAPCRRCGSVGPHPVSAGTGPHWMKATCVDCGGFVQWISRYSLAARLKRQTQARQTAMARRPPSALQLAYLTKLGYTGPPPASMADASAAIERLRQPAGGAA